MWSIQKPDVALLCVSTNIQMTQFNVGTPSLYKNWFKTTRYFVVFDPILNIRPANDRFLSPIFHSKHGNSRLYRPRTRLVVYLPRFLWFLEWPFLWFLKWPQKFFSAFWNRPDEFINRHGVFCVMGGCKIGDRPSRNPDTPHQGCK